MFTTGLQSNPTPLQRPVGNEGTVMYQPSRPLQFSIRDSNLTSNLTQTLSSLVNKSTVIVNRGVVELPSGSVSSGSISGGFINIQGDGLLLTSGPGSISLGGTGILSWVPVSPNLVLAGPAVTGFNVIPTFRSLVLLDLPAISAANLTNGVTGSGALVLAGSPFITGLLTVANISITGTLADGTGSVGTSGQVLTSTVTGTLWSTVSGGTSSTYLGWFYYI